MLPLALILMLAQMPGHRLFMQPNALRDVGGVEIAPAGGAGGLIACQTGPLVTTRGVIVTAGRSTTTTCNKKGPSATGVQVGDMVVLASGVPRIEPDVRGVLGVYSGSSYANRVTDPRDFTAVTWVATGTNGATTATVTADQALSPLGDMTADLLVFGSTTGNQQSAIVFTDATNSQLTGQGVWAKASGADCAINVIVPSTVGQYQSCTVTSSEYRQCFLTLTSAATSQASFAIGCDSTIMGGACTGCSAYIWHAQKAVNLNFPAAPIPPGVTLASDDVSLAISGIGPSFCLAATYNPYGVTGGVAWRIGTANPDQAYVGRATGAAINYRINATVDASTSLGLPTATQTFHLFLQDISGQRAATRAGVSFAAPATSMTGQPIIARIGSSSTVGAAAIVTELQLYPIARCTP